MEKCTYCVQRINAARIEAKKDGRQIADGEIVTACQQVCPTKAITFGNINDAKSGIAAARKQARNYSLLEDLNTKPRTTYLAKITNPNPEIETE
jgi:Fe-S-cluster-containing dehydrogenase component